jgi:hypothetical protein
VQVEGGAERRPPATWKAGATEPCSSEEIVLWRAAGRETGEKRGRGSSDFGLFKARCTFALALGSGGRDEAWWDLL